MVSPLLVLRLAVERTPKLWPLLAIGLVAMATSGHCWNRYTLVYLGASLAMMLSSKSLTGQASSTSERNSWLALGCYGIGIWSGWFWNWTSPGFLELHCATCLILLLHAISHCSSRTDWKPWAAMVLHLITCVVMNAWSPAMGIFMMAMWWLWGRRWSTRFARWLALCVMGVVMALFTTANTWPSSTQNQSLRERTTLWSWTLSQNMGPAHGPGKWRMDIARADLFDGKRQPRRAHNDWLHWGYELGWMGLIVLAVFVGLHPWLALISAPLFFLWFPTERPDFMLAVALVASTGKLDRHVPPPVLSIREASTPRRWVAIAILGIGMAWMFALALAMNSIHVQRHVGAHIASHRMLPPLSRLDRLSLEWFPEGVRGNSDGWMRLMQYAMDDGKPCEALGWGARRQRRAFPALINLEMKAEQDCP